MLTASPASPAGTVENAELPSCDSCLRQPATLLVTYPDARFRVCHDCLDPHLDQVVKLSPSTEPARDPSRSSRSDSLVPHSKVGQLGRGLPRTPTELCLGSLVSGGGQLNGKAQRASPWNHPSSRLSRGAVPRRTRCARG